MKRGTARGMILVPMLLVMALPARAQETSTPERAEPPEAPQDTTVPPPPAAPRDTASAAAFERLQEVDALPVLDALARAADSPLRRAMIADRRYELTGDIADAQRAFDLYYDVASADTTSAWAFFGIGRMVAARPAVLFERPGLLNDLLPPRRLAGALGLEPTSRAQQAMLQALMLDPTIEQAALTIADMAVVSMDPMELEIAARALDWVTQHVDAAPEVWLALSRIQSLMADAGAANAAAMAALRGGADPSLSLVSAASALLTDRATEERGARAYMEGTRVLSDAGAERYYRDVEQIMDAGDLRAWDGMDMESRGRWLRRWWEVRAGLAGVTVARSLGEHYRKVAQADRLFGGEYGEPTPVEQLLGTGDHFPATTRYGYTQPLDYVYDLYQFSGDDQTTSVTAALAVPIDQLRPMLTDSQVVYGLKVSMILVDTLTQSVGRLDTILYYAADRLADADSWMRSYVAVEKLPQDRAVYRLVVADAFDPRTGEMFGGPLAIRDFHTEQVEVSDLVLTRTGGGHWTRGDQTFPLTPAQSFSRTEPITIFYEIYNLPPGTRYRTDIRVVPLVRGLVDRLADLLNPGTRSLRVTFDGTTPDGAGPVQEVRTVQMPLRPDQYVIEVTVTDLRNGESTSSDRRITLTEAAED